VVDANDTVTDAAALDLDIGLLPPITRSYEIATKLHETVPSNSEAVAEVAEQPGNFTDTVKQKEPMFASDENSSEPEEDNGLKSNISLKLDSDVNACSEPLVTSVSSSDAAAEVSKMAALQPLITLQ